MILYSFYITKWFIIAIYFIAFCIVPQAYPLQNVASSSEVGQFKHKFAILFKQSEDEHQRQNNKISHEFLKDFFDNEDDPTDNSGSLGWLDQLGDLELKHGHFNEARKIYNNDLLRRMIFYQKHLKVFSSDQGTKLLTDNPMMKMRYSLAAKSVADKSIKIAEFEETQNNPEKAQEYYRIALELYQRHQFEEELGRYIHKVQ